MDAAKIAQVKRDQYRYFVGPDIPPVVEIGSGQEIVVETVDNWNAALVKLDKRYLEI